MMTPLSAQGTLQRTRDYISYYLPQLYQRVRVCAPVRVNTYVCFSVCAHTHARTHTRTPFTISMPKSERCIFAKNTNARANVEKEEEKEK